MRKNQSFLKKVGTTICALILSTSLFAQDKVSFAKQITHIANEKPLTFEIKYTATEDREINLDLKKFKDNKWVAGKKVKVKKGKGTVTIKLNKKVAFEDGNDYQVGVAIRPTGGTWKDNLDRKFIKPLTIGGENAVPTEDHVAFVDKSGSIENADRILIEVKYTALEDREISMELKNPKTNKWVAGSIKKVKKGSGIVKLRLYNKEGVKAGNHYQLNVSIRPVGTTWKETITKETIKPFTIK